MYIYEIWTIKKAEHWRTDAFEFGCRRRLENSLDSKESKSVNPKGNQPWNGKIDAEAEGPILWLPDAKSQLIWKDSDVGKDWEQEQKGVTENEMVGERQQLSRHEFEHSLGDNEGQEAWCTTVYRITKCLTWLSD